MLLDIAERKLLLQRAERQSLEDARVGRLRTLLDDVSLSKSLVPKLSLSLTAEQDEKVGSRSVFNTPATVCYSVSDVSSLGYHGNTGWPPIRVPV